MKNNTHIFGLISSSILFLMVITIYMWMQSTIGSSVQNVLTVQEQVSSVEANRMQSNTSNLLYTSTAPDRAKLQSLFVSTDTVVSLIKSVEDIGSQSGSVVTIGSLDDSAESVKMHVSVQGSWPSVFKALTLAETLPYASNIDQATIETSVLGTSNSKRTWNLSFVLKTAMIGTTTATSTVK